MRVGAGGKEDRIGVCTQPDTSAAVTGRSFVTFCYDNLVPAWDSGSASRSECAAGEGSEAEAMNK